MDGQYKRLLLQALFSPSSAALGRALKQQSIDSTALADFLPLLPAGLKARRKLLDNTGSLAVHYEHLREQGWRWLALGDADYPSLLARIVDPPGVLAVRGCVEALNAPGLAMVGGRNASADGLDNSRRFARDLAAGGLAEILQSLERDGGERRAVAGPMIGGAAEETQARAPQVVGCLDEPAARRLTRWKSTGLIVGEGRFSALVPCPATRIMGVLEWDHVVYVQPGGISDGLPGVRVEPLPRCHLALPVGLEGDLCQRFLDQDFVPRVLAIFVFVNPMLPVIPVVGR